MINPFSIYGGDTRPGSNGRSKYKPEAANENKVTIQIHSPFYKEDGPHVFATIEGYLSKELQYEAKGNYKDMYNVTDGNSILVNFLSDEAQRNVANYGYLTKKIYSNSDSPAVSFEFRCLADDTWASYTNEKGPNKISNPIKIANYLIGMTTPHINSDGLFLQDRLFMGGGNTVPMSETIGPDGTITASVYEKVANAAGRALDSITSRKPPVCRLTIGKIFEKDQMVLKNVSITISKEYYAPGIPLYADFSVVFESLYSSVSISDGDKITDEDLNNKERIFGTGFNKKDGRDTRIQFEGVGYDKPLNVTKIASSLVPPPGTP